MSSWSYSVQKANRLYNKHLSEEIKGKLINKSDSYQDMKQWLILHYGGLSGLSMILFLIYPQNLNLNFEV